MRETRDRERQRERERESERVRERERGKLLKYWYHAYTSALTEGIGNA